MVSVACTFTQVAGDSVCRRGTGAPGWYRVEE
jgi:hypothetical protein